MKSYLREIKLFYQFVSNNFIQFKQNKIKREQKSKVSSHEIKNEVEKKKQKKVKQKRRSGGVTPIRRAS